MKHITILACDPSFTAWGWAIIRDFKIVEVGCIKTEPTPAKKRRIRKTDDDIRRVDELADILLTKIRTHQVNYIVSEAPHGSQSAVAAKLLGMSIALLEGFAKSLNIPIEWYSENDAKMALFKRRSVEKNEMVEIIQKLYKIDFPKEKWRREGIADALAIYNVALKESSSLHFLKAMEGIGEANADKVMDKLTRKR